MRKSILFVLMVMVLFVVSVMPMAAHEGEDQDGIMHRPCRCRNVETTTQCGCGGILVTGGTTPLR